MGLDMYLFRRRKGETKDLGNEICYWRKANAIREYFVSCGYGKNSNCEEFIVSREMLEELVARCTSLYNQWRYITDKYAIRGKLDYEDAKERAAEDLAEHAEGLLPTSSGFFFGDTDYDDWYFEKLMYTATEIAEILADTDWENEEVLYYEWW